MAPKENVARISGDSGDTPVSRGVERARTTFLRHFASNATRSQLSASTIEKLESISDSGNSLLSLLEPYHDASIFTLEFTEQMGRDAQKGGAYPRIPATASKAVAAFRETLDRAEKEFMEERFAVFPFGDRDVETTCALSAFIFVAAFARYGSDAILESTAPAEEKKMLAGRFIAFFETRIAPFLNTDTVWDSVPHFHEKCYQAYLDFKKSEPELFDMLRTRLDTSQGELMAPFGNSRFSISWLSMHYSNTL